MLEQLEKYYEELDKEHKEFRSKHKKEFPGDCGLHYECNIKQEEKKRLRNIKEQKLHIKRLIKLIKESNIK